jgi:O-antigen ligase
MSSSPYPQTTYLRPGVSARKSTRPTPSKRRLIFLYKSALVACFIPYSLVTPLGYLSPVDIAITFLFLGALFSVLADGRRLRPNFFLLALSFLSFALVVASQMLAANLHDVSPLIKYFVFLCIIPLSMTLGEIDVRSLSSHTNIPSLIGKCGVAIAIVTVIQIARHQAVSSDDGTFYVRIFGSLVNKNWLGAIITFGVVGAAWEWTLNRRFAYGVAALFQLAVITYIGARSSTLVATAAFGAIFLFYRPEGTVGLFKRVLIALFLVTLVGVAVASGLFEHQLSRLAEISDTDTSHLTPSTSRILLWEFAIHQIGSYPFLGSGYGTFNYQGSGWLNGMYEPHNNILQIAYAGGLIGLSGFAALVICSLTRRSNDPLEQFIRVITITYLADTLVDIVWLRGDGHLFWMLLFASGLNPRLRWSLRKGYRAGQWLNS